MRSGEAGREREEIKGAKVKGEDGKCNNCEEEEPTEPRAGNLVRDTVKEGRR